MDRYMLISSDGHAGLRPEKYRDYLDPEYREVFDAALPIQLKMTKEASEKFLVSEINAEAIWLELAHCPQQLLGRGVSEDLEIVRDKIRVLHVVGRPSWDERFLRQHLKSDPNVDLIAFLGASL